MFVSIPRTVVSSEVSSWASSSISSFQKKLSDWTVYSSTSCEGISEGPSALDSLMEGLSLLEEVMSYSMENVIAVPPGSTAGMSGSARSLPSSSVYSLTTPWLEFLSVTFCHSSSGNITIARSSSLSVKGSSPRFSNV